MINLMLRRLRAKITETPIFVVGKGHWGGTLGSLFARKFSVVNYVDENSTNAEWKRGLDSSPIVLIASPFSTLPKVLAKLKGHDLKAVINASKGIDRKSLLTFSGLARKFLKAPLATLSGPTFAKEVAEKKPTACVLAGKDANFLSEIARLLSIDYFRIYVSSDPIGVEACGAVKNVLAIACGISDGLRLGHNARAALLTRGLIELQMIVKILGGRSDTVFGLAGIGDLWLTATGDLSRNRQLGLKLAKGISLKDALQQLDGTCEGIYTVQQVHALAQKHSLDIPIAEQVYRICFKAQDPKRALIELMTRELKVEETNLSKVL